MDDMEHSLTWQEFHNICRQWSQNDLYHVRFKVLTAVLSLYNAVQSAESKPTFWRYTHIEPPSSRSKKKPNKKPPWNRQQVDLLHADILLGLFFNPENGDDTFFWNVNWLSMDYTILYPRRQHSSWSSLFTFCILVHINLTWKTFHLHIRST